VRRSAAADGVDLTNDTVATTDLSAAIGCMLLGSTAVYATLFATGNLLYGNTGSGLLQAALAAASAYAITRLWSRL
jgi:hypothetical protein